MAKIKRSYFIPKKVTDALDAECRKNGYVREAVVAAAIGQFLRANPNERHEMFEQLNAFLSRKRK